MGALFASLGSSLFSQIANRVLAGQQNNNQSVNRIHTPEISIQNNGVV